MPSPSQSKRGLKGIAELVKSFVNLSPQVEKKFEEIEFAPEKIWPEVVGDFVAAKTESLRLANGTLFVKVTSNALKNDLINRRTEITELLKSMGMKVERIFWR